jgi:ribosomal protein S18
MKIIDLLNKIANEEENDLQTEFEFDGKIWNFYKLNHSEYCLDVWLLNQNITITKHKEEKKIPEKLEEFGIIQYNLDYIDYKNIETLKEWLNKDFQTIYDTIDLIIKNQNKLIDYLKSKGDE